MVVRRFSLGLRVEQVVKLADVDCAARLVCQPRRSTRSTARKWEYRWSMRRSLCPKMVAVSTTPRPSRGAVRPLAGDREASVGASRSGSQMAPSIRYRALGVGSTPSSIHCSFSDASMPTALPSGT